MKSKPWTQANGERNDTVIKASYSLITKVEYREETLPIPNCCIFTKSSVAFEQRHGGLVENGEKWVQVKEIPGTKDQSWKVQKVGREQ